ncbi:MAG TPA: glycosyltransferase family 1 protein [Blastocatellia bacterium]|nr:glycosyltransferase family 1 protein [Blastocatellia bacterium]HMV85176.1 glycosyltransferase family 1 protein [Blastocatellia bacterium]HMX26142.1 glycosyltransferase family 1 protein [Blastocatellia bacterium]HMY71282.1 glycosyltransferase family 1 protein [Blastocatellia bacterium]HMZ18457.1 glycosyltransferase family 1 protein [Blastocatellia bacterium]
MHIGIDAHAIGAQQGGNETYIRGLIRALAEVDGQNRYTIFLAEARAAAEWRDGFVRRFPNFAVRLLPRPTPLVRVPLALGIELRRCSAGDRIDVLHVQYTAPPFCPAPVVATIHDLAFEHLPETFTRRGSLQLKLTVRRTAQRAARIATVSEYSRQDLLRTYRLAPEKVAVTYNGIEPHFTAQPASQNEAEDIRHRFGIGRDFLLAVGSLQPRKNLVRLIRAYARLRGQNHDFTPQLVIVGRKLWLADEIFAEVRRQGWAEDVILTGYVADEDLPKLYRAATAFVYPSLFEGFGLPPVEAMACGTPVVTSNVSSLPEVAGDAALLIDPADEQALAAALLRIVGDQPLRARLREQGIAQAAKFTWREAAEKTLELYRESFEASV